MNALRPPYGLSNFRLLRDEGYAYVDKTRFIRWIERRGARYLIFLRPRRFGKSLWLSVLRHHYDIQLRDDWDRLFSGLDANEQPSPERSSYRVLHIDFSAVPSDTVEEAARGMTDKVRLGIDTFLDDYGLGTRDERAKVDAMSGAAAVLADGLRLAGRQGPPVYVLIDEYDHFTNELLARGQAELLRAVGRGGFVRKFYEALKQGTWTCIGRIFMTGVTPVTLDALTSGFNIAANITHDPQLHELMGFSPGEVRWLFDHVLELSGADRDEVMEELRGWYNGYCFVEGEPRLYNSDMVLYYLDARLSRGAPPDSMLDTNVVSDYRTIENTVRLAEEAEPQGLVDDVLLHGRIGMRLTRRYELDGRGLHRDDIASLLYYLGLLTVVGPDPGGTQLGVPNRVIGELFWDTLRSLRSQESGLRLTDPEIRRSLLSLAQQGDARPFVALVERYLSALLSNRDLRGFSERDLKMAFLMLVHAPRLYLVQSEPELARGYADFLLLRRPAVRVTHEHAFELKYLRSNAGEDAVAEAGREGADQLRRYLSGAGLADRPNLLGWVVVFSGARCVLLQQVVPGTG